MSMFLIGLFTGLSVGTCLGVLILGMLVAMRSESKAASVDPADLPPSFADRQRTEVPLAVRPQTHGVGASQRTQFQSTDTLPFEIPYLPLRMANTPGASRMTSAPTNTPHNARKRSPAS